MVFDPRSEDPLVIVGSDFFLTVIGNTLSQKGGNIIRFYGKDCCPDNLIIKRSQVLPLLGHLPYLQRGSIQGCIFVSIFIRK